MRVFMKISLAGWSLHRRFRRARQNPHPISYAEFPKIARTEFGIDAMELNSPFLQPTAAFAREFLRAADGEGVKILNIAVDERDVDLSSLDKNARRSAVERNARWLEIAAALGGTAIRCNTGRQNLDACIESFGELAAHGSKIGVKILIENHWGLSEKPENILKIVQKIGPKWLGTLPDFGNWPDEMDRYAAMRMILPHAGAIHAKMYDFDERGEQPKFDVARMIALVAESGYDGCIGIEFEGEENDHDGVLKSKALLETCIEKVAQNGHRHTSG
jgi:sugar phosphate isomerase/epimerase